MDLSTLPLISADSHVEEPSALWQQQLPAAMREKLPPELGPGDTSVGQFARRIGIEDPGQAGSDLDVLRDLTADPERRFAVMRRDGIAGECIYPTAGLYVWNIADAETGEACCRIYNDWIARRLAMQSPRFRCAGMIPTWSVAAAIAEVERIANLGLAAAMLPLVGTPEYNHPQWEPLWSAIEASGMPVVMHQGSGHDMLFYRGAGAAVANLLATQSMAPRAAGMLATSGVLAAHPDLHFVFVETNAGWLAWTMATVDYYYEAFQQYEGWVKPILPEHPSHYLRRQIHGTFQFDPVAVHNLPLTGVAPLLWGSDFPHAEGTYPHSRKVVGELFARTSLTDTAQIVAGTAIRLFHFDADAIAEPL